MPFLSGISITAYLYFYHLVKIIITPKDGLPFFVSVFRGDSIFEAVNSLIGDRIDT